MKKGIARYSNIILCAVVIIGFMFIIMLDYHSEIANFRKNTQQVSEFATESCAREIFGLVDEPIKVSQAMANDFFLKEFLQTEPDGTDKAELERFSKRLREFLDSCKTECNYNRVYLVSSKTNRAYGVEEEDVFVSPNNPDDVWYYEAIEDTADYRLSIERSSKEDNFLEIYVNAKIYDSEKNIMGIIGVEIHRSSIRDILKSYEQRTGMRMYIMDTYGNVNIATKSSEYDRAGILDNEKYASIKREILDNAVGISSWYGKRYVVSRFIPSIRTYVVADNNAAEYYKHQEEQLKTSILILVIIMLVLVAVFAGIIRRSTSTVEKEATEKERSKNELLKAAMNARFEGMYEFDITHGIAANEETIKFVEDLGLDADTSYDGVLRHIAQTQIEESFREGYLQTFCSDSIIDANINGIEKLEYEALISPDGSGIYKWMKFTANILYWDGDETIRAFICREDIQDEKETEEDMLRKAETDSLTGLYNKAATEKYINRKLSERTDELYALFILDIDNFKSVNDTCGHKIGDNVITEFADTLKANAGEDDIVGRIGGDEFIMLIKADCTERVYQFGERIVMALEREHIEDDKSCHVSSSVGAAMVPEGGETFEELYKNADTALYKTKERGKNGYTVYKPYSDR